MSSSRQPTAQRASGEDTRVTAGDLRTRRLAFSAILLTTLLAALDQTIVSTALPRIVGDLGGFNNLSWVVSAYLLASTVTIPLYGKLSDLYGRRLLFTVAISIFLVGSTLSGLATSMNELIAFRAVQGIGAGGLIPLAQAAIGDLYSPRERGRYQGYVSAMWGIAAVTGPLVGGTLTQAISWRWIFYVNLPLGLLALVVVIKTMGHVPSKHHRIDYAGATTLGLSLALILIACAWSGTTYAMTSPQVVVPFVAGLLGLVVFALIERRASEPIIPVALLSNRIFVTAMLGVLRRRRAAVRRLDLHARLPAGCTRRHAHDLRPDDDELHGRLGRRLGHRRATDHTHGPLPHLPDHRRKLCGRGSCAADPLERDSTSRVALCAILVLGGIGMGMTVSPYLVAVQNAISPRDFGSSTATMNLMRAIGASLAVSIFGALLASRAKSYLAAHLGEHANKIDISRLVSGGSRALSTTPP